MGFVDVYGNRIRIVAPVTSVFTDAYENNLRGAFHERFTSGNADFTLTGCVVSDGGLVCSGFCKAGWNKGTTLNDGKVVLRFTYTEDIKIGVFLSASLAFLDTAAKYIGLQSGYMQGNSVNDSGESNVNFDFVVGNEYQLEIERKFWSVTVTIKDLANSVESSVSGAFIVGHSANITSNALKSAGLVVFSGNTTVTGLSYFTPFCGQHLKALILGDSITEGQMSYSTAFSRRLLTEYFHNNALMCGVGGSTPEHGMKRFRALIDLGYSFDYVISYLCTNDGVSAESKIPETTARYQGYVDEIAATGAKVIWCALPSGTDGAVSDSRIWMISALQQLTGLERLIEFDKALGTAYSTHVNDEGNTKMYEYAKAELEIIGV